MKQKRMGAVCAAAAVLLTAGQSIPVSAGAETLKIECESGRLTDCEERAPITWERIDEDGFGEVCDMTGWSGDSYVYIDRKEAMVTVDAEVAEDGYYALGICYIQCFGTPDNPNKTQYLLVNGESQGEVMFPFNARDGWTELQAGYVHLNKGKNTISVKSYWGYTFLDYFTLSPAPSYLTDLKPAELPCNPNASTEAKKLYHYLRSVYGKHILSGQQEYCGSHCYNKNAYESQGKPIHYYEDNEAEFTFLEELTGEQPAIRGIDFLFYNTTQPYFDDAPERAVAWYKEKGGIPTVTYHWNVPTNGKNSTDAAFYVESTGNSPYTNFSITKAVTEGTWEHEKIDADLALLAEQLGKARDAKVPILFRPLHEAEGAWFWWGAEGAEPCKKLYRYMWDKLTNEYGLNNLLWIWTGSTSAYALDWYPGDKYVDFIGCDKYNAINNSEPNPSAISATFYSMVAQTKGQKMVVMSENDTIPSLDNLVNDRAAWLYFCPWYQRYLTELNDHAELKKIYQSDYCITLDELPDWDSYDPDLPVQTEPDDTTSTEQTSTSAGDAPALLRGDTDCDGRVAISDAVLLARYVAEDTGAVMTPQGKVNAECTGNDILDADDIARLLQYLAGTVSKTEFEQ